MKKRNIWLYWSDDNVRETAPYLNQKCIQKWLKLNQADHNVNFLNRDNAMAGEPLFRQIVNQCRYPRSKVAEADLLRLILLKNHGGVWADTSVYPMRPLSEFYNWLTAGRDFFAYRFHRRKTNKNGRREISVWFLIAEKPCNYIVSRWLEEFIQAYLNSENWKYFTLADTFCSLLDEDPVFKREFNLMNNISPDIPQSIWRLGIDRRISHPIYKRPVYLQRGKGEYEISILEKSGRNYLPSFWIVAFWDAMNPLIRFFVLLKRFWVRSFG